MRLRVYAQQLGVSYKTAWKWFHAGKLRGYQTATGTIIVTEPLPNQSAPVPQERVAVYARVSAAENRPNLDSQAQRLLDYCAARGYQVQQVVKEIGSGVNDTRPQFLRLLADPTITRIVVEHRDRATRFGWHYLETLLQAQGRTIEAVNLAANGKEDELSDLTAIIYSFCARLYGQRRAKRATERITQELHHDDDHPG